jgi:hypothetical protein
MPKPTWKTPHLTVVARGKPEEKVLLGCKHANGNGPNVKHGCSTLDCSLTAAS